MRTSLLLSFMMFAAPVLAADAVPEAIAPYVDDQTVLAAKIDFSKIDVEAAAKIVQSIIGETDELKAGKQAAAGAIASLKQAGITSAFALVNMADVGGVPV